MLRSDGRESVADRAAAIRSRVYLGVRERFEVRVKDQRAARGGMYPAKYASTHVGVFAGGALPGTIRIEEIDPNRSRAGETIWEEASDEDYSVASFRGQDLDSIRKQPD